MKFIVPLFIAVTASYCAVTDFTDVLLAEWTEFKLKYGKKYQSHGEEYFRMKVFLENKAKIAKHNAEYDLGIHSYTLGMNKFGDLRQHEFNQMMNGFNKSRTSFKRAGSTFITPSNVMIPDKIDWRQKGAVTPIKDQGYCASCYAFSATGALEGQQFRKTGQLVSLSEQNLLDCSDEVGNYGCKGGATFLSFIYVKKNKGIDTEESYPYEGEEGTCFYNPDTVGATDTGYVDIKVGDEEALKAAVASVGPISATIDATKFGLYSGGIYCDKNCSSSSLNHDVLVVGYDTDEDTKMDYWIVKNSWGLYWGEDGYVKMCRNEGNNCGIATMASYPLV